MERRRQMSYRWLIMAGLLALLGLDAALLLSAADGWSAAREHNMSVATNPMRSAAIPPLDARAPAHTQTATFALG
jgi:hypothetical protein